MVAKKGNEIRDQKTLDIASRRDGGQTVGNAQTDSRRLCQELGFHRI